MVGRAIQVHGASGTSNEMPLGRMFMRQFPLGPSDGPAEVHTITVARQVLKEYTPAAGLWPTEHIPARYEAALAKIDSILSHSK